MEGCSDWLFIFQQSRETQCSPCNTLSFAQLLFSLHPRPPVVQHLSDIEPSTCIVIPSPQRELFPLCSQCRGGRGGGTRQGLHLVFLYNFRSTISSTFFLLFFFFAACADLLGGVRKRSASDCEGRADPEPL